MTRQRRGGGARAAEYGVALSAFSGLAVLSVLLGDWALRGAGIGAGGAARVHLVLAGFGALSAIVACLIYRSLVSENGAISRLRRSRLSRDVRRGIAHGEFELHFQPQIDLDTGLPCAVEALLRWRRANRLRTPAEFLPDVESTEAIGPLTDHVLGLAVSQAARWRADGMALPVSVNLSAANLREPDLTERVQAHLRRHELPATELTLEVTETAVLDDPEQARAMLDRIAELGVRLSIDDFGTGYSSLLWLRLFPLTEVKIDRTFVQDVEADGEAYVAGVIRLAHDLGLSVVAEGVEGDSTLETLSRLGCDTGQGYLFARPLPPADVGSWIEVHQATPWAPRRSELTLDGTHESLRAARELVGNAATDLGFTPDTVWELRAAVSEALATALTHRSASAGRPVKLRVIADGDGLRLEVSSGDTSRLASAANGAEADLDARGRGFAIMASLVDDLRLRRSGAGADIRLSKRSGKVPGRPPPAPEA